MSVCNNPLCKATGLRWALTKSGWRIVNAQNQVHLCRLRRQRLMNEWMEKHAKSA